MTFCEQKGEQGRTRAKKRVLYYDSTCGWDQTPVLGLRSARFKQACEIDVVLGRIRDTDAKKCRRTDKNRGGVGESWSERKA